MYIEPYFQACIEKKGHLRDIIKDNASARL